MARRPITIFGEIFTTKIALKERVRMIIARSTENAPIDGADRQFILELLAHHRHYEQKVGVGIASLLVRTNHPYRDRGFWIIRKDSTETDFSWVSCIDQPTHRSNVLKAMRVAIRDQIIAFRDDFFAQTLFARCPLSGEPLDFRSCHVDHEPPHTFDRLALDFLKQQGVDFDAIPLIEHGDGVLFHNLDDPTLERAWIEYHRTYAHLRVLSQKANLSLSKIKK